jgi:DNA-binding transcriptional ArsR family regulator
VPRWRPDFLTPIGHGTDLDTELGWVLATSTSSLTAELRPRIECGQLPDRVGPLAAGDAGALRQLADAIRAFHAVAVEPYWTEIVAAVQADRTARGVTIADHGIEQVLATLSPCLRWHAATLSYECPGGADLDLKPDGRGLVLVPSFLKHQPGFYDAGDGPVVIGYPIEGRAEPLTTHRTLADLLGRTRAAVLGTVNGGRNTTEIAKLVGTSLGSVSQHTAVLRSAGLITTSRTGPAVLHALTPLGRSLLQASSERGFSPH